MAVTQTDEGLELQLLDYLLMAREATSVEITEEAWPQCSHRANSER